MATPSATSSAGLRVLIVDAQQQTARNLCMVLSQWGHDPKSASGSWQALEIIGQWQPDAVFIDAAMPLTDGYQLARIIRTRFAAQQMKIFVVAERKTMAPPEHERFFDGLLLKPVVIQKLRDALQLCPAQAGA